MKKIILTTLISCLSLQLAYAEEQNKSMVENFSVTPSPFKPIALSNNISLSNDVIESINQNSLKYIDSYLFTTSKQNSEKIVNDKDIECIVKTSDKKRCLSTRGQRLYQNYKMSSFIDGIYNQAKINDVKIDDNALFKNLENNINTSNEDFHQPPLLSLIDEEDVKSNLLLKLVSIKCMSNDKDPKKYMQCLIDSTKGYNENVFFNIKIKCLVQTSEKQINSDDFSIYLQACINNEMLSDNVVKWIAFQSHRLGSVYFEDVLHKSIDEAVKEMK